MCTIGQWSYEDEEVEEACWRGWQMAVRKGRGVYLLAHTDGSLHIRLSVKKPAVNVLAVIGMGRDGQAEVVWMEEYLK